MITGHAVDACIYLWIGYLTSFILRSATAGFRAQWLIPGQPGPREAIQQISVKSRHLNPKIHWLTVSDSLACSSRPAWALNLNQLPEMVGYGDPARGQVRKLLRDESAKIWANPLVLPARLCGAAARNCAHHCIGKVCCLLLVQADYIRPRARPRGHEELLKLLLSWTARAGTACRGPCESQSRLICHSFASAVPQTLWHWRRPPPAAGWHGHTGSAGRGRASCSSHTSTPPPSGSGSPPAINRSIQWKATRKAIL